MRLLLDTHVLLWALSEPTRLGTATRSAITDRTNVVEVSSISAWEISIKRALGRLRVPDGLSDALIKMGFVEAPFTIAHALAAGGLPPLHGDPFDRALIAQATVDGAVLVTADRQVARYPVALLDPSASVRDPGQQWSMSRYVGGPEGSVMGPDTPHRREDRPWTAPAPFAPRAAPR